MTVRLFFANLADGTSQISQTGGGGANRKGAVANLLFGHNFHNCMKMKETRQGVYLPWGRSDLHLINKIDFCYYISF